MSSLRHVYACLFFLILCVVISAQKCERLDPNLFSTCVKIGHNQTFTFPSDVDWVQMSRAIEWYYNETSNCSINQAAPNTVDCALILPLCREGRKEPLFPCRRVCNEMALGCSGAINHVDLDYIGAMCQILPNQTAATGKCFEPTNFTPTQTGKSDLLLFKFISSFKFKLSVPISFHGKSLIGFFEVIF